MNHQYIKFGRTLKSFSYHLMMICLSIVMIFPFFWMISSSLKDANELYMFPPTLFPQHVMWSNYVYMFKSAPWGTYLLNTLEISLAVVIGQLVTSSLGAYAFARLKFPGREFLFTLFLTTLMIPYAVLMIPLFKIIMYFGWVNTHWALIVPALTSAFGTFLLRQFFMSIPTELDQAAMIDGCGFFGIYWHMILPNAKPALAALGIFTFLGTWNDFLAPLIYLNSNQQMTLTLGLANFQGQYTTQWSFLMAGSVIISIPIIIMFMFGQKFFIQGIAFSGAKE